MKINMEEKNQLLNIIPSVIQQTAGEMFFVWEIPSPS